jgi:DNA (cytosine-5)-methyltransferase 1
MPTLLDLFSGAGGAGMGYHRAGWEVVGVDLHPQPRYPFMFVQSDAVTALVSLLHGGSVGGYTLSDFDAIHASPPCQRNSTMTKGLWKDRLKDHPDLITPIRPLLKRTGKPYIIENVPGAPLHNPVILCGSMFGLKVRKHRLFECSFPVMTPPCNHKAQGRVVAVYGHSGGSSKRDGLTFGGVTTWRDAMQIDWMTGAELAEAIPPAYTEHVAKFIPQGETR